MKAITLTATSPEQRSAHPFILMVAGTLSYFIYFAVLGALVGLLFQALLSLFWSLKRHRAIHQKQDMTN